MQDPTAAPVLARSEPLVPTPPALAARVAALFEVVLTSGFPTQLAIGLGLIGLGLDVRSPDGRLSMTYAVTLLTIDAVVLVGLIAALLHLRGERLSALLLGARPIRRETWLGLACVPVVYGLAVGALVAVRAIRPELHNVAVNPFAGLIGSGRDAVIFAAVAVLSGGIKEECQRAFVLRRFEQHLGGAWLGLVIFSVVFGAGHFIQGWDVGIVTTLVGLFWGVLYLKRGSVMASAVSHSGFNVAQIVQFVVFGS